jgi:hypothetical protein
MIPFINGTRHSWASITINLLGRIVTGVSAISYEEKQEKKNNYGAGIFPVSRGLGKYEASAKITLFSYEVDAILKTIGLGKRLIDIEPFDIVVTYMPVGSDLLVNHLIRNAEFTNNKRDIKQGDTVVETEFDLVISHITWL